MTAARDQTRLSALSPAMSTSMPDASLTLNRTRPRRLGSLPTPRPGPSPLPRRIPSAVSFSGRPAASASHGDGTFGAGTIIDCRNATPSPPCGTSPGSPDPRETGRHRASPTTRHLHATPATATLRASHYRPLGVRIPSVVRLPAPRLEFRCFQIAYGAIRCLDGRTAVMGSNTSRRWRISRRARRPC